MSTQDPRESISNLAQCIDHTLLRPEATKSEIEKLCAEAREFGFKTVCVEAKWLPVVVPLLAGSSVLPITVVGFPGGSVATSVKRDETKAAVAAGAAEVDMVLNRELLKAFRYADVLLDIQQVVSAAGTVPVKVILETSELTREEKIVACTLAKAAGAAFVKTSTGFSRSGASEEDVVLMRQIVGPDLGVKASGGIRTTEAALQMIRAGASRLGVSASIAIVSGQKGSSGGY